ncbi:hypothetical protein [Streptomyces sp. NPDC093568]|uniref:hypothetical protein n=1 Tax=Streptomyces sp. NPDC093568 TaxID=3366041 RepID=UPI0037FDE8C1
MNRISSITDSVGLPRLWGCLLAAALAFTSLSASGGAAVARPAASSFGSHCSSESGKVDYATDRLMLMLYGARERVSHSQKWKAWNEWSNAAMVLVEGDGLSDADLHKLEEREPVRSGPVVVYRKVPLEYVEHCLPEAEYDRLYQGGTRFLLMIGAMSFPGEGKKKHEAKDEKTGRHSEELALDALEILRAEHPEASLKQLTWASERYYCDLCRNLIDPDARRYHAYDFSLTETELAEWKQELKSAERLPAGRRAAEKKSINGKYESRRWLRGQEAGLGLGRGKERAKANFGQAQEDFRRAYETAAEEEKKIRSYQEAASDVMATQQPSPCPTSAGGTVNQAALTTARTRARDAVPDCGEERQTSGLVGALADPGAAPGGIDFTTLELRYLSVPGNGLRYAFGTEAGGTGAARRSATGLRTAREASDAFFVWLTLPRSTFWVNLNPNEPDRIVDSDLGRTDVGRILLQADLQLKKTTARLIHPDRSLGQRFWNKISGTCMSFRTWIVPGPAEVVDLDDELYILDAPLGVQMESQYLDGRGSGGSAASCGKQSASAEAWNEEVFRDLILPQIEKAVNDDPAYAELRRVYLSRVAAEWYRERTDDASTTYGDLIDRGDVDDWVTETDWKPRETFDQYVRSYRDGEFDVTRKTRDGDYIQTRTYIFGGVDFTGLELQRLSSASAFSGRWSDMTQNTERATKTVVAETSRPQIWLGGDNTPYVEEPTSPPSPRQPGGSTGKGSGDTGQSTHASDAADQGSGSSGNLGWLPLAALGGFCVVLLLKGLLARRRGAERTGSRS